jgi:N-acetylglutamate synthase-like GNAT family acetyltransferase
MHSKHEALIRQASRNDVHAIVACVQRAYSPYVEKIGMKPTPMLDDYHAVIEQCQVSVLDLTARVIGLVVLEVTQEGFLLNNIAVDPDYKGRGFGSLLLQFAEKEAMRQGFSSIYLYTNVMMTESQAIYVARGYAEYARGDLNGRAAVFMRKKLSDANG